MKKINTIATTLMLLMMMQSSVSLFAQTFPKYILKVKNDTLLNSKQFQFDVYIYEDPSTPVPLNLNSYQLSFNILSTNDILNGGTLSGEYITGTSQLINGTITLYPSVLAVIPSGATDLLRVYGPFSSANYIHIPQSGLRIGTFRVTNTVDYGIHTMDMVWWNSFATTYVYVLLGSPPVTPYKNISPLPDTVPPYHMLFLTNPILNKPLTIYNMTGGGNYCSGGPGVLIGLSGSETGVVYQLMNGSNPVGLPVMGTGGALSFGYHPAGTYTCIAYRDATYITNTMNGNAVSVIGTPSPVINGNDSVCPGAPSEVYTTSGGKTNYVWTVIGGSVVSGGTTTDSTITIHWGTTPPASVRVNYIDVGCTLPSNTTVFTVALTSTLSTAPTGISASNNPICAGNSTTLTVNGGSLGTGATWQWYSGSCGGIHAGTGPVISVSPSVSTTYYVRAVGNCNTTSCVSSGITVSATLPVGVSISANPPGSVCSGTNVTFTAVPVNGGSSPIYQWYDGSSPVGSNSATYSNTSLVNGDIITCHVTSSESCATGNPATSNPLTMSVITNLPVSVGISASPSGAVCTGQSVTFTASPVNGGTSPVYLWKLNNNPVGTNNNTYTNSTLSNGDVVTCIMTSNAPCISGNPATSNPITMTVNPNLPVSVSVTANPSGPVCPGTGITFTAIPVNGGSTPVYEWKLNGNVVGTNSSVYTHPSPVNGDVVTCKLTSNATPCATGNPATSTPVTITVNPGLPVSVSISANPSGAVCQGTNVTFTASPVNGGSSPVYQWYVNSSPMGTNSNTYSTTGLSNGDIVTCSLTSNAAPCATGNPATSNPLTMSVITNLPVSVGISASPSGPVCTGQSVTFTASPVNGGTSPVYLWKLNNNPVGTNNNTYTNSTLSNGDVVTCIMTSNATPCITGNPATSNPITMTVNPNLPVSVSVTANPSGPVCPGTGITFTATPVNGGSTPVYEWKLNGSVVGTNSSVYTHPSPVNGDVVTCKLTSNATPCATGNPATSTPVTITVNPDLPVSVSISANPSGAVCQGTNVTFTASPVNGGNSPVYQWYVNSSPMGTNSNTYSTTGLSNGDIVTCSLTSNTAPCATGNPATSNPITMTVNTNAVVTVSIVSIPSGSICSGTSVTFTATPVNSGSSPTYQWYVNGSVDGTNSNIFTTTALADGDTVTCKMTSNAPGCISGNPAHSNSIVMSVMPLLPVSVAVNASATSICPGSNVTFTAVPVNGGTSPFYQWYLNGVSVGSNSVTYSNNTLADGDRISCKLTSTELCTSGNPAYSDTVIMTVSLSLTTGVSISTPSASVCQGAPVVFTAVPVNGGSIPVYQWYDGINAVGSNSATYSTTSLADGDVITCQMTSSESCVTGNPATSNPITMTVNPNLPVSVSITANPAGAICQGSGVTFTAVPVNGGSSPVYLWKLNNNPVGTNNNTYTNSTLSNGDVVTCIMTSNATPCITGNPATSNPITMTVNPNLPVSVSVTANPSGPVCPGTGITFTATPVNGGSTPVYEWKVNGNVVGTNSSVYTHPSPVNGDVVTCELTSNATPCATGNPATSTPVTITVNPDLPVSVSISANPSGAVCQGTNVTFTASPVNGGSSPVYQWYVNSSPMGTNSNTYSTTGLSNGDIVTCSLTSNATPCATGNPATSNPITMAVNPNAVVTVSIVSIPSGSICSGTSVTFTSTPVNGGSSPTYQWYVNGSAYGTNSNIFTTTALADGDTVTCKMTSNAPGCISGNPAHSNNIIMSVMPLLPVSIVVNPSATSICTGSNVTFTAVPANGGTAPFYQWFLNGVSVGSNSVTYSNNTLANGDKISCKMTSNELCTSGNPAYSDTVTMTVSLILTAGVSISTPSASVCQGAPVVFTAVPVDGGSIPVYQWYDGINAVGSNSATYSTTSLADGDVITCQMTSSESCVTGNPATSNPITMTVNPNLPVSVSITANPAGAICQGSGVTFTAVPVNGGSSPAYLWKLNNNPVGTNNNTYTNSTMSNGDVVTCIMTSNAPCISGSPATSNPITMIVNTNLPVSITITANPSGAVCSGQSVTFTASPANGGTTPAYQWKANNNPVGTNSNTYTSSTLTNGTVITCVMTSNATPCITGSPATSNPITMTVNPLPVVHLGNDTIICANNSITLNAGSGFSSYAWSNGTTNQTVVLNGSVMGNGSHTVSVQVTNSFSCYASDTILITVSPCTDINTINSDQQIGCYPNPVHGILNIAIEGIQEDETVLMLINSYGQLVYRENICGVNKNYVKQLDLTGFSKGIYYLQINAGDKEYTGKIIVN